MACCFLGPPGTGKTLLARAVAGEAGVPFFFISGADFVEMFVGVGASTRPRPVRAGPAAPRPASSSSMNWTRLGRSRMPGAVGGGYDEKEQTLNQLLAELDGFDPSTGVILLAATNRPEVLGTGEFNRSMQHLCALWQGRRFKLF